MGQEKKARGDYGEGSFYYRESERRWVGSFYVDGQRKTVAGPTGDKAKTRRVAKAKFEKAKQQAERGELVASSNQTLAEYLRFWLEEKRLELKPGTYPTWKTFVDVYIVPFLGKRQLQKLLREHIQKWVLDLVGEELMASSIHTVYSVLHGALSDAEEKKIIGVSPAHKITLPRLDEKEVQILSQEQARAFLAHLAVTEHRHEALFVLALTTGMRRGEILALKWSDLDLEKGRVQVQRTVVYIRRQGYMESEPKTRGSRRSIVLTSTAIAALKKHRHQQLERRLQTPDWQDKDLVFCGSKGSWLAAYGVIYALSKALKSASLPEIRFHDLRHTAATLLLRSGASLKSVQYTLGHSTVHTTMRYLHLLPGMEEEDMARLNSLLFG